MEPISMIILLVLTYFISIIAGMAGGSYLLFIPLLLFFGIEIHEVIGITKVTTLAVGLSFINYMRHKDVNLKFDFPYVILVAVGTVIGSLLVIEVNAHVLQTSIAFLMICIAAFLMIDRDFGVIKGKVKKWQLGIGFILLFIVGIYYGFYAVAASLFVIFILTGIFKKDFVGSIGNSKLLDFTAGVFGILVFGIKGLINYKLAIPLGIVYFLGSWTGSNITIKKGSKFIKYIVAIIAIAFAIKLLFSWQT